GLATAGAGDLLPVDHHDAQLAAVLRPDPGDDRRRPTGLDHHADVPDLPRGLPDRTCRLRLGFGDHLVHHLADHHRYPAEVRGAKGALLMTSTLQESDTSLDQPTAPLTTQRKKSTRSRLLRLPVDLSLYGTMIIAALVMSVPLIWMALASFK